jgi:phosphoenolpyruvate carboxykinase (ATP)
MQQSGPVVSRYGLAIHGIGDVACAYWNYTTPALYEEALRRGEGRLAVGGALAVTTGVNTGRSAGDKFIVEDPQSSGDIDWGAVNKPMSATHFDGLKRRLLDHLRQRDVFIQDCYAGASPDHRLAVRVITETAWHSLFARNMFIVPPLADLADFEPEFTVIQAPSFTAEPARDGTNSEVFIVANFASHEVLIGGTSYAGEIKKSIFSVLNFLLPSAGVLPMHSSVNVGDRGDSAVFFGLSGTGKTTLSADPKRTLIGDDEHGWSDAGLFNFEGGCYAKVIRLSESAEPEIYATTRRFGTVLENVVIDPLSGVLDLDDASLTENTRASYPLDFIPNASQSGAAGHPNNVIMLTADAFGVLPPISKLTPEQAMYHFLSGYTAKVAGTEKGLGPEPQATFSTCFGAPFMPRHPSVYAKMLGERIARHDTTCWLVNTGWSGGSYGVGSRMKIQYTRALLHAALDGSLAGTEISIDPSFGLHVPQACSGVPAEVLNPRDTWADKQAYDATARDLVGRFHANFTSFDPYVTDAIRAAGPVAA